jgi:hypothetical protein
MHYTAAAVSTLFVKVRVRQTPYANKTVAIRVTAHFFNDFKPSQAMYMRELNTNANMQQLQLVVAQLQQQANAVRIDVNMPESLYKKLNKKRR